MNPWRDAELFSLGERTLIVRIRKAEGEAFPAAMRALSALAAKIEEEVPPGLLETVPTGRSLAIFYDPFATSGEEWRRRIEQWIGELPGQAGDGGRIVDIPVCYGGEYGPDLPEVAARAGITEEEAVRLHSGAEYMVGMIGFAPGFPYLRGLPPQLATPRRPVPRTKVPAGSVAIGGGQTGIYPADLPGGWHIIGRTPVTLFDPAADPPSLLAPGDRVRFVPVEESVFRHHQSRLHQSKPLLKPSEPSPRSKTLLKPSEPSKQWEQLRPSYGLAAGSGERGKGWTGTAELGKAESGTENPGEADGSVTESASGSFAGTACESGGGSDVISLFRVRKPGLYTTVQDAGRPGFQRYGVSPGGAMDPVSYRLANRLVGNRSGEPALEMTLAGPELEVLGEAVIACCGADMAATVNGKPLPAGRPVYVEKGDILRFGTARAGCRAYLAVAGGFAVPKALGGCGMSPAAGLPGLLGRALVTGDVLHADANRDGHADHGNHGIRLSASWRLKPHVPLPAAGQAMQIRVVSGPEFGRLSEEAVRLLLEQFYTVEARSNRMGLRLAGTEPVPSPDAAGMVSEAVAWGTVQLPPGGQPIVLAADRQTTGGYPRVLQVIAADLSLIGQAAPGVRLVFRMVDMEEAAALLRAEERRIRALEWAIDAKWAETRGRTG